MRKRYVLGISLVLCLMLSFLVIAQPSPGNQLPYDIKVISTQEVGNDLWTCYEVYDDIELLFYDCAITDNKIKPDNLKIILETKTKIIYDRQNRPFINNKIVDNNMKCWEYSKKIGGWVWIC